MPSFFLSTDKNGDPVDPYIGLYIKLREENSRPSLSTVAEALINFDGIVNEISYQINPSFEARLELASFDHGSIKINAVLQSIKTGALSKKNWITVAAVSGFWLAQQNATYLYTFIMDEIFKEKEELQLSDEAIKEIKEAVDDGISKGIGRRHAERFLDRLSRDKSISGIGIMPSPNKNPIDVTEPSRLEILRPALIERAGDGGRTRHTREELVLVSPTLIHKKRHWKFIGSNGEFGAYIDDLDFVDRVLNGEVKIPMSSGITIIADVEYDEDFHEGAWKIKRTAIKKVYDVFLRPEQRSLFGPEN